jgi:hypothetical protein
MLHHKYHHKLIYFSCIKFLTLHLRRKHFDTIFLRVFYRQNQLLICLGYCKCAYILQMR